MHKWIVVAVTVVLLSGCADAMSLHQAIVTEKVGFWHGLWHGIIIPIAWVISLFSDEVAIYAIYNNGGWYDFGFFVGIGGLSGVGFLRDS